MKKIKGDALEKSEKEKKIFIEKIFVWPSNTFWQGRRKSSLQRKTLIIVDLHGHTL